MKSSPPSRLLEILDRLRNQNDTKTTRAALAAVFQTAERDTEGILLGIASLLQLLAEAKRAVSRATGEHNAELHMAAFSKLERTFSSISLSGNPKNLAQGVTAATEGLRFSADLVERLEGGGQIDEELLSSLVGEVNKQIELLLASELSEDAKRVLHERLKAVREAAEQIHLFGLDRFEAALDAAVGATVRYSPDPKKPKDKKVLDGIAKIVDLGLKLIALAQQIPQLPGISKRLLGSGE